MDLDPTIKKSLLAINNIKENIYKKLLENTFSVLTDNEEIHAMHTLLGSNVDVINDLYNDLLTTTSHFIKYDFTKNDVVNCLNKECNLSTVATELYCDFYEKFKSDITKAFVKTGYHHPHIADVRWKIDYIVKESSLDNFEGPLFKISLITYKCDVETNEKKIERINFTCNSNEMQDLVYKLKDAVKHCENLVIDS